MVTLNKIYTRTGDDGRTRLASGAPVSKSDARVEAYGAVFSRSSFAGANLTNASFVGAYLEGSNFSGATLTGGAATGGSPGSPKIACSSGESASSSSACTDSAPASRSASDQASTVGCSTTKTSSDHMDSQALRQPSLSRYGAGRSFARDSEWTCRL